MIKNVFVFSALSILLLVLVYVLTKTYNKKTLPYFTYNHEKKTLQKYASPLNEFHKVHYWSFINHRGNVYTLDSLNGKIYVADYFFISCPGICKSMGINMKRLYEHFKNNANVIFISHTSKPHEDKIENLREYANSKGVNDNRWIFLTGDSNELYRVAKDEYFILNPDDTDAGKFVHTELFVLVDKNRFIRGYYDGTDTASINQLIHDINVLLNE